MFRLALYAISLMIYLISPVVGLAYEESSPRGVIKGEVRSADDGSPVVLAAVCIFCHSEEVNRGTVTHNDGDFVIRNVPAGDHTLQVQHIGYETTFKRVRVTDQDTTYIQIDVQPSVFRSAGVEIVGEYIQEDEITTYVERVISGRNLRLQLGRTIAETLEDEPGMAQRSMGPAPARPVLRGLGGERLLILEDGGRTGDLSATSSDHALAIEPMTAEHIELIRGPSALVHGSNTMGGVINVIRGQIPNDHPDHFHWSGSFQGETVNYGTSGGVRAFGPLNERFPMSERIAFRFDLSGRNSFDISTPGKKLMNTGLTTLNTSLGLSYIDDWGMVGFSGNLLDTKYGVPGGEGIADAHPNGVDIEMFRRYVEGRMRYNFSDSWARRFDVTWNYAYYYHKELEKPSDPTVPQPVGAEFGVLTNNAKIHLHHNGIAFFEKGLVGVWGEHRNYASGGRTFTPETIELSAAAYSFQERDFGPFNLQLALRYDVRSLSPEEKVSVILEDDIVSRDFTGFSGSVMGTWYIGSGIKMGTTAMRSHRSPNIEELYSEGPHLANFSYEVGNPGLTRESGWGNELFFRISRYRYRLNFAIYRNQMNNFIFAQETGEPSIVDDRINTFRYTENRVLMAGAELSYELQFHRRWTTGGSVSHVRGDFIGEDEAFPFLVLENRNDAVPMMPPLSSRIYLEYGRSALKIGGATRLASRQNRTDQFEEPTDGYAVFDLYSQYHLTHGGTLHTFSFSVENIVDTEYRNHLSRIKSVMPEPGRNVKLLYRVYL